MSPTAMLEVSPETNVPRYDISDCDLGSLEETFFRDIKNKLEQGGVEDSGLSLVWIQPNSPFADIVRAHEKKNFSEIQGIVESYEDACLFMALVDTRGELDRVVHASRFTARQEPGVVLKKTGVPFIDDIILSGQDLEVGEYFDYCRKTSIDPSKSLAVETNFRIREADVYNGCRMAQIGYIALFDMVTSLQSGEEGDPVVYAHINHATITSLGHLGVEYRPVADKVSLRTPTIGGKFDDNYSPVEIPNTTTNKDIFAALRGILPPQIMF